MENDIPYPGSRGARVTWLGLLLAVTVAAVAGLAANYMVIRLVGDHLLRHDMEQNGVIAGKTVSALHRLIGQGMAETEVLARLQQAIRGSAVFGYFVFIVDTADARVMLHSEPGIAKDRPRLEDLFRSPARLRGDSDSDSDSDTAITWQGRIRADDLSGRRVLLYLIPVNERWTLGVVSGARYVDEIREQLTEHLNTLLLVTATGIALLGFLAVRGIGRHYERALEREVQARTAELETAYAEMLSKTRLASIGETAATLTHEIRNPLASIKMGLSELAGLPGLDERQQRRMQIVLEQVDRLDELLSGALSYVRPVRISPNPVILDELLDQVHELLEPLFSRKSLQIRRRRCAACPAQRLDPDLMAQALLNLLKNAVEASPDGGTIDIDLALHDADLVLEISNAGPVIPERELIRVFEPFVSTKSLGTGLGLPLVKRVIEEHGGRIEVVSNAETGTCFHITLPVVGYK